LECGGSAAALATRRAPSKCSAAAFRRSRQFVFDTCDAPSKCSGSAATHPVATPPLAVILSAAKDLSSISASCHNKKSPRRVPHSVYPGAGRALLSGVGGSVETRPSSPCIAASSAFAHPDVGPSRSPSVNRLKFPPRLSLVGCHRPSPNASDYKNVCHPEGALRPRDLLQTLWPLS
jgi:hypothetical protein